MREKMASLGNLVAGVAHEVNNPIGAVNSAADVARRCVDRIVELLKKSSGWGELEASRPFQQSLKLRPCGLGLRIDHALDRGERAEDRRGSRRHQDRRLLETQHTRDREAEQRTTTGSPARCEYPPA